MSAAIYIHGGEMAPLALLMALLMVLFVVVAVPLIGWVIVHAFVQAQQERKPTKGTSNTN